MAGLWFTKQLGLTWYRRMNDAPMARATRFALTVGFAIGVFDSSVYGGVDSKETPLAFVNVNVVPMDREVVLADQTLFVQDGKIVSVGPAFRE